MTTPNTAISQQQPIGAYTLNSANSFKAGNFVVNPAQITPYSFYDDLKKGDNFYKDTVRIFTSKKMPTPKTEKKPNVWKKILGWTSVIALSILTYKKWDVISNFIKNFKK